MSIITPVVRADAEMRARLTRLVPRSTRSQPHETTLDQDAAQALLARIVWSRLTEPGDAVAGALITALGAAPMLDLIASRNPTGEVRAALRASSERDGGDPGLSHLTDSHISSGIHRWLPRLDRSATLSDVEHAIKAGLQVTQPGDPLWPAQLDDLGFHSPLLLWVKGEASHLVSASLAVVGARACSGYGTHVTADLTEAACLAGYAIVSGAAYGIDAVAHRTALASSSPTIAVLAGGADRPYPASHAQLIQRIAAGGVICSEMVPGSAPTRWRFLQRNRVIAALGAGTLVTEAGVRSGSLNTAGHSAELGRGLAAVPGPVTSASSAGCHTLIREYDATLVSNRAELLEFLGTADPAFSPANSASQSAFRGETRQPALHRRVLDALPLRGSRRTEDIARIAGIEHKTAAATLAELELLGSVLRHHQGSDGALAWRLPLQSG